MRRLSSSVWLGLCLLVAGCSGGGATGAPAATATPADEGPAIPVQTAELPEEGPPRVSVVVRAGLAPGRPVPYRLTFENRTRDVLVPFSVEASDGSGGSTWGRTVAGEVVYDESTDRFVETPVYTVQEGTGVVPTDNRVLLRSALFPGETLVQEFDVRYSQTGSVEEKVKLLFHRLTPAEFEVRCYVGSGEALPRRYAPLGRIQDPSARRGALLAGFYLRTETPPEAAFGEIALTLPALPPAIANRFRTAGFDADRAMAADWAGGWLAGDSERSVLVTAAGTTRQLPGVPFEALQVIDGAGSDVSFCVSGAKREEIVPLFPGREIVPYKCLHVSMPRTDILPALERISTAGFAVFPVAFQLREALDLKKVAKVKPPATKVPESPSPSATATKAPAAKTPTPTPAAPVTPPESPG